MSFDLDPSVTDSEITDDDLKRLGKIESGFHHARLISVENHTSSTQTLSKRMKFEIIGGAYVGRKVQTDLFLTDSDGSKARQNMFACRLGVKIKNAQGKYVMNPNVSDWPDLIGTEVIMKVVYPIDDRTKQPKDFPDVEFMEGLYALNDPRCAKVPRAGQQPPPAAGGVPSGAPPYSPPAGPATAARTPAADPYAGM